jgi:uncharacterized protein YacL
MLMKKVLDGILSVVVGLVFIVLLSGLFVGLVSFLATYGKWVFVVFIAACIGYMGYNIGTGIRKEIKEWRE